MVDAAIGGGESVSHRKVRILFDRYSLYLGGMPWAAVINCVLPLIIIWIICFLPLRPG